MSILECSVAQLEVNGGREGMLRWEGPDWFWSSASFLGTDDCRWSVNRDGEGALALSERPTIVAAENVDKPRFTESANPAHGEVYYSEAYGHFTTLFPRPVGGTARPMELKALASNLYPGGRRRKQI